MYVNSGRTLLKLKSANGSQVFIRNAQVKMLEDDRGVQITFYHHEQMTAQMSASQLAAETEALEDEFDGELAYRKAPPTPTDFNQDQARLLEIATKILE